MASPPRQGERPPFGTGAYDSWIHGRGQVLGAALDDALVTRYLRTVLYRKRHLADRGLAFVWGTVAWAARAWERQAHYLRMAADHPADHTLQLDVARSLDLALKHSHLLGRILRYPALGKRFTDPRTWMSLAEP